MSNPTKGYINFELIALFVTIPILVSIVHSHYFSPSTIGPEATDEKKIDFKVVVDRTPTASLEHKHQFPGADQWNNLGLERPMVIAMVGLPARGKSYLVKMIQRYLNWTGYECEVFNVGKFRREQGLAGASASFFSSSNKDQREGMAMAVQEGMYAWIRSEGTTGFTIPSGNTFAIMEKRKVAIFDATNTTRERRAALISRAEKENVSLLFVESICNDQVVLKRNYMLKLKNDDYVGMDPTQALEDFITRVKQYETVYETVEDDENNGKISYIKLINVGQKLITRNCSGFLASQIAFHLQNVHIQPRRIYLTLTAENSRSPINGSDASVQYFDATGEHIEKPGLARFGSKNSDKSESERSAALRNAELETSMEIVDSLVNIEDELLSSHLNIATRNIREPSHSPDYQLTSEISTPVTAHSRSLTISNNVHHLDIFDADEVKSQKSEDTTNGTSWANSFSHSRSLLSTKGYQYAIDLTRYIKLEQDIESGLGSIDHYEDGSGDDVLVLAGTSDVHYETISHLRMHYPYFNTPLLEELRGGDFHGLGNDEIQRRYPIEYAKRCANKLTYRYPGVGGESYLDVIERVKPIIIELERQRRSVVVVCHLAVFRCIHAYFMGTPVNKLPYAEFKKNTVYVLSPGPSGCTCTAVDPATET